MLNFSGGSTKPLLNLGHRWVTTSLQTTIAPPNLNGWIIIEYMKKQKQIDTTYRYAPHERKICDICWWAP